MVSRLVDASRIRWVFAAVGLAAAVGCGGPDPGLAGLVLGGLPTFSLDPIAPTVVAGGSGSRAIVALNSRITQSYDFVSFDGAKRALFEFSFGLFDFPGLMTEPALLGDFVLLRDPSDGEFVAVGVDSGEHRRFNPFAALD